MSDPHLLVPLSMISSPPPLPLLTLSASASTPASTSVSPRNSISTHHRTAHRPHPSHHALPGVSAMNEDGTQSTHTSKPATPSHGATNSFGDGLGGPIADSPTASTYREMGAAAGGFTSSRVASIKDKIGSQKSRTLPNRRNTKKNFTVATRLKTYMSQQKIDGVYCVVALMTPDETTSSSMTPSALSPVPRSPPPPSGHRNSFRSATKAHNRDESSSEDSSSSEATTSSDEDDDDSSDAGGDDQKRDMSITQPISSLHSSSQSGARKKKKKSKLPPKPKIPEPVIFVLNRIGGVFGKNPAVGGTSSSDTVSNLATDDSITVRPTSQPKQCVIQDPFTSKKHFQVLGDTKGKFYISDLGSLNGTFVRRNFDPLLALGMNASKVYGAQAAAVLHGRDASMANLPNLTSQQQQALHGRGMSPVMCSSPTHRPQHAASSKFDTIAAQNASTQGREGWGLGSWASTTPNASSVPSHSSAAAASSLQPAIASSTAQSTNYHQSLLRDSSGSGENSATSQSGSASVNHSGYASVGTQWLNSQSHASTSGYRLHKNSMFLLGKCELCVVKIHDIDNPIEPEEEQPTRPEGDTSDTPAPPPTQTLQSYHVIFSYSYKPPHTSIDAASGNPSNPASTPTSAQNLTITKTKQIGILGGKIGRSPDVDISIPLSSDSGIEEYQSEIVFENGKFFLKDIHPSIDRGLWYRLSMRNEESAPMGVQLFNGDRIKVGVSEFNVNIRSIPPPLSITSQGSAYEIGTALEGNFLIQKEMQDRLVAIGNYGGHANQAFFGIYDGHQERTVADFAAAAFHHNLLEEINDAHRRAEAEFDLSSASNSSSRTGKHKSLSNSTINSPIAGGMPAPASSTSSASQSASIAAARSRSASEAIKYVPTSSAASISGGSVLAMAGLRGTPAATSFAIATSTPAANNSVSPVAPSHISLDALSSQTLPATAPHHHHHAHTNSAFVSPSTRPVLLRMSSSDDETLAMMPPLPARACPPRPTPTSPPKDDSSTNTSIEEPSPKQSPPTHHQATSPLRASMSGLHIDCSAALPSSSNSLHVLTPQPHTTSPPSNRHTPATVTAAATASASQIGHRKNSSLASAFHAQIGRLVEIDVAACIKVAYARTATQIKGMGDAASYGGSTAVSVLLWYHPLSQETRLYASNIGDSRAVIIRDGGRPELLSHLHIGRDPAEQARVRAAGGRIMQNGRLAGCLEVTRAFGDRGMISFGLIAEPYILETVLQPTDTHLIVSSDGLFDVLTYDEIARMLRGASPDLTSQQLAFALVEAALKRKGRDNMSVIVVKLRPQEQRTAGSSNVEAGSSGSLISSTSASSSSKEDLLALLDLGIPKPLALNRVPSIASIYAKPSVSPATAGSAGSSGDIGLQQSQSFPPARSPSDPLLSSSLSQTPLVHTQSAFTSPQRPQPMPQSDYSTLEENGRAVSDPFIGVQSSAHASPTIPRGRINLPSTLTPQSTTASSTITAPLHQFSFAPLNRAPSTTSTTRFTPSSSTSSQQQQLESDINSPPSLSSTAPLPPLHSSQSNPVLSPKLKLHPSAHTIHSEAYDMFTFSPSDSALLGEFSISSSAPITPSMAIRALLDEHEILHTDDTNDTTTDSDNKL